MNVAQVSAVFSAHHPDVVRVFQESLPEVGLRRLDECVLEYLLTMLEGQTSAASYLPEETVRRTLKLHFSEFGVCADEDAVDNVVEAICTAMQTAGLVQKPKEDVDRLANAVSIGRQYEENLKKAMMINSVGKLTVVNTNEDWSWETKRNTAKETRRKRREEEKTAMLADAYEEFLHKRGIANAAAIVKLHKVGDEGHYSTDICCDNVHIHMGKQTLLEDTSLTILSGHKYGLVGRNGMGKTTLLRALTERELEGVSPFVQILHVEQEVVAGSETPLQVILSADVEREQLLCEEQALLKLDDDNSSARLRQVYERLDAIEAHSAEARAASILNGLSFTREMMSSPTKNLSGGWRMRVALARALFVEPDVLLLDEPTNHLDLFAVLWLEQFLKNWRRSLVVVSHSRSFLNNVCQEIIHIDDKKLRYYTGNYEQFESTRVELLRQQQKTHEAQERQRAHMQKFVDRFRYNANRAKMAQSRIKMLERMEVVAAVSRDPQFSFKFPEPEPVSGSYMQMVDCEFGYKPGKSLLHDVNFGIDENSRVGLLGANGAGKSTFMNLCCGKLEPRQGHIVRNKKIRIAHFAQHHLDALTPQLSSIEFMRSKFPNVEDQQLRAHLGALGLTGDKALQPIYTLSGGQKSRAVLAWVTFTRPHLLLLDEPTNHLDIDTIDALVEALLEFKGGLLVISHDEHFITAVCDELYVCANNGIRRFDGDFKEYRESVLKQLS